jgi:CheY-like chemotaxis protein
MHYAREMAYFEIEDTGIGIAESDIERIFLPFERSSTANLREDIGTGLGLTISNMLTHVMGGTLSVKSEVGRGSTFLLKMYLSEVHTPRPRLKWADQMSGYTGMRKRILIVDDQAQQRQILKDMLTPLGFDIIEADSGANCLSEITRSVPDLLLLDISMPGMDGWTVCNTIRDLGYDKLPIVIVSANAFDTAAGRAGFPCHDSFVVKPVSLIDLLSAIKQHLSIDWIPNMPPAPVIEKTITAVPAAAELNSLLELGAIGYIKGIQQKLDALEQDNPDYAPFADVLRALLKQFRLNEYTIRLKEMLRHDTDNIQ